MSELNRGRRGACGHVTVVTLLTCALTAVCARTGARGEAPQSMAQQSVAGVLVTFEFDQTAPTTDQITILFSNGAIDARKPPEKFPFGDGVVAQFSVPVRQSSKTNTHVTYSQRWRNRGFLDSRYIRVINTGTRPWFPTTISLTVAGQRVLDRVAMYPRKGFDAKGGIAGWNRGAWRPVYWETELFRYTHPAKVY